METSAGNQDFCWFFWKSTLPECILKNGRPVMGWPFLILAVINRL
jgi:hypothetical protein